MVRYGCILLEDEVMDINDKAFIALEDDLNSDFKAVYTGIQNIKKKLKAYSDGKTLKDNEIVGGVWKNLLKRINRWKTCA